MRRRVPRLKTTQQLCDELYNKVSMPLSDAWVSDDAGQFQPSEYVEIVRCQLMALEEARKEFKAFLRRHRGIAIPSHDGTKP